MFEQTFTLNVTTDAEGRFHASEAVSSPFSLDIKLAAVLQTPAGIKVDGTFALKSEECSQSPVAFCLNAGESFDLGKWRVIDGDNANIATAEGHTEPAAPNTEVTVLFTATPSFF